MPAFLRWNFKPGQIILSYGPREDGKTHAWAFLQEYCVKAWSDYHLLTNVPFIRVAGFKESGEPIWEKGYPERVHEVSSVEDIFRRTGEILAQDPRATIGVGLDELQNYALSETGQDPMNVLMNRWAGVPRKFRQSLYGMTPVYANIPKRWRHLSDDPTYGGNATCLIIKDPTLTARLNAEQGTDYGVKQVAFVQVSYVDPETRKRDPLAGLTPIEIPVSEWTRPWERPQDWEKLKVGDVVYDHWAPADLDIGGLGFDFQEFMKAVSGQTSFDTPGLILEYFEKLDKLREDLASAEERKKSVPSIVRRLRDPDQAWDPISWAQLEFAFMTPASTLRGQVQQMERDERWAKS